MARLGSIKYQVKNIIKQVNGIGKSKLESRQNSNKKSFSSGHKISPLVHSYKYTDEHRRMLLNLGNFAKNDLRIKDMSKIDKEAIKKWIDAKNIVFDTASNYLSMLNKINKHLNITNKEIEDLRNEYKKSLQKSEYKTRAYNSKKLEKVDLVKSNPNSKIAVKSQIAFELQRDYGLRVSAATHIKIKNINGNLISYREKGGKISIKELPGHLINSIKNNAKNGIFEVNKKTYSRHLKLAIEKAGEKWEGTHGMRHSFAQDQLMMGKSKKEVSLMMGHVREEITNTYLR